MEDIESDNPSYQVNNHFSAAFALREIVWLVTIVIYYVSVTGDSG